MERLLNQSPVKYSCSLLFLTISAKNSADFGSVASDYL